ncbi:MAG: NUMOD3 domain-containing DNA-binding protein, partial [Promethearchaeota archaeon]
VDHAVIIHKRMRFQQFPFWKIYARVHKELHLHQNLCNRPTNSQFMKSISSEIISYPNHWNKRKFEDVTPKCSSIILSELTPQWNGKSIPDYKISKKEQIKLIEILEKNVPPNIKKKYKKQIKNATIYLGYNHKNGKRKHKFENFSFQPIQHIEKCSVWTLKRAEAFYSLKYNTIKPECGYNMTLEGPGGVNTPEQNRKISKSLTGRKRKESTKQRISQKLKNRTSPMKGRKQTPEHIEKRMVKQRGRSPSRETKRKISESTTGKKHHLFGKHLPDEWSKNISEGKKGLKNSKESNAKIRETKREKFYKDNFSITKSKNNSYEKQIKEIDQKFKDCILKDMEIQEVAKQMDISDSTVRNYMTRLYGQRSIRKARELEKQARDMQNM